MFKVVSCYLTPRLQNFFRAQSAAHDIFSVNKIVGIFIFLAEKFSCSAMFSKKEFAIVHNLRFISRTNFLLS